jgi:hypothetical protein
MSLPLVLGLVFGVLWAALAFLALRAVAARFVYGRGRPEAVAALVVLAFAVGRIIPIGTSPPADAPVVISDTGPAVDVHSDCQHVKPSAAPAIGSIDAIGEMLDGAFKARLDRFVLEPGAQVYLGGWAATDAQTPALAACFVLDGIVRSDAGATYGGFRPDVAQAYHTASLAPSGYVVTLPRDGLSKGSHRIGVAVVSSAGTVTMLTTPITFRVP